MKHLVLFLCLILGYTRDASGQAAIAKLKYEQAEEAFSTGDYQTTLVRLQETESILNSVNPKILYLRILAQEKLVKQDKTIVQKLINNCTFYLKEYKDNPALEDKYKDVYLVLERMDQFKDNADFNAGYKHYEQKNYDEALSLFKTAATQGYARAYSMIGVLFENGFGVEKNYEEAYKNYKIAANKGNARANYLLGRCYYHGIGVGQNPNEALKLFMLAAEESPEESWRLDAITAVADVYFYKRRDGIQALQWYEQGAEKGCVGCMAQAGYIYLNGSYGAPKNLEKAFNWLKKGSEKGNDRSFSNLGYMYMNGEGVEKDYAKALEYFNKGSNAYSYRMIGWMYFYHFTGSDKDALKAIGIRKDADKALEWFTKAADLGDHWAMYYIGCMYYTSSAYYWSDDVKQPGLLYTTLKNDDRKGVEWYKKAAENGNVDAMYQLSRWYKKRDFTASQKWKDKAIAAKAGE